jgi:sugar-specific transcriptional regulator TrmB
MDQREAELKEQQRAIRVELKEIQVARAALACDAATGTMIAKAPALPTIKEMAKAVLTSAENGMTSGEILAAIKDAYGRDIDRTSLSPQLSRLKADDEVFLNGERWFTKALHDAYQQRLMAEIFDVDDKEDAEIEVVPYDDDF